MKRYCRQIVFAIFCISMGYGAVASAYAFQLTQWYDSQSVRYELYDFLNQNSLFEFPNSRVYADENGRRWLLEKVRDKDNEQVVRVIPESVDGFVFPMRGSWALYFGNSATRVHRAVVYLEDIQGYTMEFSTSTTTDALYSEITIILDNKIFLSRRIPEPLEKLWLRSIQELLYSYPRLAQWEKIFADSEKEEGYIVTFNFAENHYLPKCSEADSRLRYNNIFLTINCLNGYGNMAPMSEIEYRQLVPSSLQNVDIGFVESIRSYLYANPEFVPSVNFTSNRRDEGFLAVSMDEVITFLYTHTKLYPGHMYIFVEKQTQSQGNTNTVETSLLSLSEVIPYVSLSGNFRIVAPTNFQNLLSLTDEYTIREFLVIPMRIPRGYTTR